MMIGVLVVILIGKRKNKNVELLGTGKPLREFLYVDDLAEAIYLTLKISKKKIIKVFKNEFPLMNVGTGKNISIKKLAYLIKKKINFNGSIKFNSTYPDGTYKKNLNSSKIKKLGWKPKISLEQGLEKVILSRY